MQIKQKCKSFVSSYQKSFQTVLMNNDDGYLRGRRGVFFGCIGELAISRVLSGVFFTTLLLILLGDVSTLIQSRYIAIITSVQTFAGLTQILSPFVFESIQRRKTIILCMRGINYGIQIVLLPITVLLPFSLMARVWIFTGLLTVATLSEAISTPARSAWHIHSLPVGKRSDYFFCLNIVNLLFGAVLSVVLGKMMDYFTADNRALAGLLFMRGGALLLGIIVIWLFSHAEEPVYNAGLANRDHPTMRQILTVPWRNKPFLATVCISVLLTVGNSFATFYSAYLLNGAQCSYGFLSLVEVAGLPFAVLGLSFWNARIQKRGWLPTLALSLPLYGFCHVLNAFVTVDTHFVYILSNVWCQLVCGGYTIGNGNLPFLYAKEELRSAYLAFYSFATGVSSVVGVWFAERFITWTDGKKLSVFGLELENRSYACFVTFAFYVVVALFILAVIAKEKKLNQMALDM